MQIRPPQPQLHNHLLASLSGEVRERLLPSLELCTLPLGKVLYDAGAPILHVYFPIDCVVSFLNVTAAGDSTEISAVGNEGMIGVKFDPSDVELWEMYSFPVQIRRTFKVQIR